METKINYEKRTEKTPVDTSLVYSTVGETITPMNLKNSKDLADDSKFFFPCLREYNLPNRKKVCNRVFVLGLDGKPLTPCKPKRAKQLMKQNKAKPTWNKFGEFGIKMLEKTGNETAEIILGIDNGTKFEGLSIISEKVNNFNVMWKLPDKNKLVKKLEERRHLRRARRFRNCRRREARFNNRNRKDFIAPSQLMVINSRLKCIKELFNSYPISKVAVEDVKFNHRDKRWGKNFSTIEVGKTKIKNFLTDKIGRKNLISFGGFETKELRDKYELRKTYDKSKQHFYTHCVDSFVIAMEVMGKHVILNENMTYIDDNYRPIKRRLHDTQYSKGNVRYKFSSGKFQGISKGCIIGDENGWLGQLVGGTKNNCWYQDFEMIGNRKIYQKGKSIKKISWTSHHFKINKIHGKEIHPQPKGMETSFSRMLNEYIFFMTNIKELMDEASIRSQRIDKQVKFRNPDYNARKELLKFEINKRNKIVNYKLIKDYDINELTEITENFNCSDIVEIPRRSVKEKLIEIVKNSKTPIVSNICVTQKELKNEIKSIKLSKNPSKSIGFER